MGILQSRIAAGIRICAVLLTVHLCSIAYQEPPGPEESSAKSYIVKRDDTMWDLAGSYLGDPFLWQEIWQVNRQIQDPHWIYPGDRLIIPGLTSGTGLQDGRAGNEQDAETPAEKIKRTFGASKTGLWRSSSQNANSNDSQQIGYGQILSLTERGYLSSDMLRQVSFLWTERDAKKLVAPGNASIDGEKDRPAFHQYDQVRCEIFGAHTYTVGDTVDIIHPLRYLKYQEQIVNLIKRVALGRVDAVERGERVTLLITLFKAWDLVTNGDRVMPMERIDSREIDTLVDATDGIRGTVFERVETSAAPYLYQTFIFDRGNSSGVQIGDLVNVYHMDKKRTGKKLAQLGCVINVQPQSSTVIILEMYINQLDAGDEVAVVKRVLFL